MIVTPDYGLSDIWHFNYPLKNLLDQSLHAGTIPLWTDMVGNGFPVAAEGQIGVFSPINWFIFGLFPMPQAFLVALASAFIICGIGTYLFARSLRTSKQVSFIAAIFSSFNGYVIVQMTHMNLLQSFAFIPWAFFFMERLISTGQKKNLLWLGMIFAQMILVGYPQTFFNTVVMLVCYALFRIPEKISRMSFFLIVSAVIALSLSAIQVIPLLELTHESDAVDAAARQRFIHPLTPVHLLTLLNPFWFGDPSKGTYPLYGENWGMFWENMLYVGWAPLIIMAVLSFRAKGRLGVPKSRNLAQRYKFITLRWISRQARDDGPMRAILGVLFFSLLFSLGKYTPLAFFFRLPPLSFTRISSRFLVFSNFSLGFIGGLFVAPLLTLVKKRNIQIIVVIVMSVLHIAQVGWAFRHYHLWVDSRKWLTPPKTAQALPAGSRAMSLHQSERWNETFLTKGWFGQETAYDAARNSLDPNSNMIFGIKQLGVYAQQLPKRQEMIQRNMYGNGMIAENIRNLFGVTHIIEASTDDFPVRENRNTFLDIRTASIVTPVHDIGEALGILNQRLLPESEVLWESKRLPQENEEVVVVNRSFYPGWKIYYNPSGRKDYNIFFSERELKIYPVNINQQAVIVPKGTSLSTLSFRYDPLSYKIGGAISLLSLLIWSVLMYNPASYARK